MFGTICQDLEAFHDPIKIGLGVEGKGRPFLLGVPEQLS
jgi:hypothetical protein